MKYKVFFKKDFSEINNLNYENDLIFKKVIILNISK